MNGINAIPTEYKGYKFRSRLEARWAVFFDACGVRWEYEPEGLILSDGTYYLPDFYLSDFHCFFEVKHNSVVGDEAEEAMSKISDGYHNDTWAGILCFGDPMDDDMWIFCQETDDSGGGSYTGVVTIGIHPVTGEPYLLEYEDTRERCFFSTLGGENSAAIPMVTTEHGKYKYNDFVCGRIREARKQARQARFEHGETPAIRRNSCYV